ncbi:MAG: S41 family peptidase [Candidatus Sericytochromatia bacterium]
MRKLTIVKTTFLLSLFSFISCSQDYMVNKPQYNNSLSESINSQNSLTQKTFNRDQLSLREAFYNTAKISITSKNSIGKISDEAYNYIDKVLYEMKTGFIRKKEIDWSMLYKEVFKLTATAQTTGDTYIGIVKAMQILNEKHTFFITPDGKILSMYSNLNNPYKNKLHVTENISDVPANIGYVKVTEFSGDDIQATAFAKQIETQIIEQDKKNPIGWVVDLRGNEGGNMWPMLAGLVPILGSENPGFFLGSDGKMSSWDNILAKQIEKYKINNYQLHNKNSKVAILIDKNVASSGEATAISFVGRTGAKSFGQESMGFSSANASIPMSDGATLVLTSAYLLDRNKKTYIDKVSPDVFVQNEALTMQTALKWLQN